MWVLNLQYKEDKKLVAGLLIMSAFAFEPKISAYGYTVMMWLRVKYVESAVKYR